MSAKQILDDVRNKMESGELKPSNITENKIYTQMFDECFNVGVDACIAKVKQLDTYEPSEDYIFSKIVSELEQLKKPLL